MKRLKKIFQALLGVCALILTATLSAGRYVWRIIRRWWKRRPKWLRWTMALVLIIAPVSLVVITRIHNYQNYHDRDYWDRELNDQVTIHSFGDNTWRLYNNEKRCYTTDKFSWLSESSDDCTLAVYALPNRRGYVDTATGEIIIDAATNNYSRAWVFSEGLAAVEKEGKIGFINEQNEVVIPFVFDYSYEPEMHDIGYLFHDGYCTMTNAEGKMGIIDRAGNWTVKPEYDQIWAPQELGYRTVIKGDKYGILDSSLRLKYEAVYDYAGVYTSEGNFVLMRDNRMWQEDNDGKVVVPFMYESSTLLCYPTEVEDGDWYYYNGISDYMKYRVNGKYGILNRHTGKPLTPAIYDDIRMLSPTLFEVSPADCYGYNLLNTRGQMVRR